MSKPTVFDYRNVLVGKNGLETVKLSDVGLSRTMTSSDYYRKKSNMKVVVKIWLRIHTQRLVCRCL